MGITWRLTLWYMVALALILAAVLIAMFFGMRHLLVAEAAREVRDAAARVETLVAAPEEGGGNHEHVDLDDPELTQTAGSPLLWVQITGGGITQRSRSLGLAALPAYVGPPVERRLFGERVILFGKKLPWASVQIARPLTREYRFLFTLLHLSLLLGLIGIGLAAAGGWILTRLALRPVKALTRTMLAIGLNDLTRRVEPKGPQDELYALAQAFNKMLDRLEEGFQKQREFLAAVSHDLRTPLTVVKSYAGLLCRWGKDDPQVAAEAEEAISRAVGLMERLVNDLLLLIRVQSPAGLRPEEVALDEVVAKVVADAKAVAEGVSIMTGDLPRIMIKGDRDYLRRAVWALVDNAIKYNRPGGSVTISLTTVGNKARLRVADTGLGIAAADVARIFDCFYRADSAREQGKGFGLGLCLVKSIVEAHGGRVEVSSEPGQGSIFTLVLPLPFRP